MTAYSPDRKAERLLQLSNEVNRIAGTLARLSVTPSSSAELSDVPSEDTEIDPQTVASVLRARRLRSRFFPADLFADPAWDMLLDLLHAELVHNRVSVSSLCSAAAVPPTTALRWLNTLVKQNLVLRRNDPHDGRRVFVELAQDTSATLRRYFAEVADVPTI